MPPRAWRLRIDDMLDAIRAIEGLIEGLDFNAFRNDERPSTPLSGISR